MPNLQNLRRPPAVRSYPELLRKVREILVLGRERIEQEKVRTYWEAGKQMNDYLKEQLKPGQKHADRGKQVVIQLAEDLEINAKVLYRCMRFAEAFPYFASRRNKHLTWTHYRTLTAIADDEKRRGLAERAERLGWSSPRLEQIVKRITRENSRKTYELLEPKKGALSLYQIRAPQPILGEAELKIDLGFRVRKKLSEFKAPRNLKAGDVVESRQEGKHYEIAKAKDKTADDLFTYRAQVLRVTDGDTLYVEIDLGFGDSIEEYLRLRGIDTPEIETRAGKEAAEFVKRELREAPFILLRTSQTDQWDRYVADVFYTKNGTEYFLNNRLLEAGWAERVV